MAKIPGGFESKATLSDTRKTLTPTEKQSRANFLKNYQRQHKRTLSLTSGIVKTEEPPKADQTGWTDTMRRRFNILLDKLNAGSPSVSDLTAGVHRLFGKRGYQHGDRQIMADFVSQLPPERQMNIAKTTEALIPKTHDPLTKIVFNDIHDAAERAEHLQLFIPQGAPKVSPTLATSGPATVKTPQEPVRAEGPRKAVMDKWTDALLGALADGSATASNVKDVVHQLFGEALAAGDKEFIESKVSNKASKCKEIADRAALLASQVDDPLTKAVLGIINKAALNSLDFQNLMFMPQFPAQPKPSPAPKPSIPPTVKKSIPKNPLTGNKLRYWDHRGTQAMKDFLDVLSGTDEQAKRAAFYGTKGLRDVIREVTDKTNHADVEELDGWITYALKGRSKQQIESIVRSVTAGFGAKGDIYTNVRARLVHRAELVLKTMRDLEARDARGVEHTKRVIKALGNGSTAELKDAFFDPGYGKESYGKNPGLYEVIKEIVPDGNEASERACFDKWLGEALKGRLLLELIPLWTTIKTNMANPVCLRNGVFQTFEQVLAQHIDERKKLDDFMQAITANGDIDSAAAKFELTIRAFTGKGHQLSQARMSALIADYLGRRPNDVAKLKDKWAELPDCPSVTALRGCLGLSDSMAVENLLLELAKWNETKGEVSRLRELLLLAGDQLRIGGEEEIRAKINAALDKLTPQQTIAVASSYIRLVAYGQEIHPMLGDEISAATSRVAPQHFIAECLAYHSPPFGVLEAMENVKRSSVDLTGVNPMYMQDFLNKAIGEALDDLSLDQLNSLRDRLSENNIPQDVPVVSRFRRLVARRREQLSLLPKT